MRPGLEGGGIFDFSQQTNYIGSMSMLTFKFRVKDANTKKHLSEMAIVGNQVWNFHAYPVITHDR